MQASPLLQEFHPGPALLILAWVVVWGGIGGVVTPRIYRRRDLDASKATLYGTIAGAGLGPILLIILWTKTPELDWRWNVIPSLTALGLLYWAFATYHPANLCVTSGTYVISQVSNGILIGILYGVIAIGLTLIFSILGIVSFAHGQFYMLGGYAAFFTISQTMGAGLHPIIGLLMAGLITFVIGVVFEYTLLRPMHLGKVERPGEYAILLTFGLAFFLEYSALAILGANPRKVDPFFNLGNITIGAITLPPSRVIAAGIGLLILVILLWFLNYTWLGKALRAVSQDKQAAAVVGINPLNMNTLAFGLGAMLAGLSGAALVQVLAWVPNIGALASTRSFVVIVLGGMGSLPGAMIGGIVIGIVESLGVGCFPDVSRALAYQQVFGMIIFAVVLLLKPTGLFGREL
ncbi:MAG: branched-chain amino acid ABC transporter permease [Chloroflexi bacterium]|nr:MAG: branched-chain amino acid ABC transporter permease [Chloroflexota bacterium]